MNDLGTDPRRCVPPAVFLAPYQEPPAVLAPEWRRQDKALVLEFRAPQPAPVGYDDEEEW